MRTAAPELSNDDLGFLSPEDVRLLNGVLQLMGVTGEPTEAQFAAACRLIDSAVGLLTRSEDVSDQQVH